MKEKLSSYVYRSLFELSGTCEVGDVENDQTDVIIIYHNHDCRKRRQQSNI